MGSITITGAQIGRQQRSGERTASDDEKEYRHAFLIVEAKKGPGGNHPRHVLCAESDNDRDSWVEMLVRYVMGTYSEEPVLSFGPTPINTSGQNATSGPRSSTSSNAPYDNPLTTPAGRRQPSRAMSRDEVAAKGPTVPISMFAPDANTAKLFQNAPLADELRSSSPVKSSTDDRQGSTGFSDAQTARRILERGQKPSSLPDSSPLSSSLPSEPSPLEAAGGVIAGGVSQRANSEMGHYPDLQDHRAAYGRHHRQHSPEQHRTRDHHSERKSYHPTLNTVTSSPTLPAHSDRAPSPEKPDTKAKISGPLNGAPIPAGYKFGGKDAPPESSAAAIDRREKAKSRSFWGFGKPSGE